jgi:integrase
VGPGSGGPRGRTAEVVAGARELLHAKRILIHEGDRRVKTREAVRDLPIPPVLERALAVHLARVAPGPADLVFPGPFQDYGHIRRSWRAACGGAKLTGATPHDARHTFAVHAPKPESRSSGSKSSRTGASDPEAAARVDVARREIKPA